MYSGAAAGGMASGRLSSLLGVHLNATHTPDEFGASSRGQAVRAALGERAHTANHRQPSAPSGSMSTRGSRRGAASSLAPGGADAAFVLEAKLASAEQQARLYRERIGLLERQLHVAQAANKVPTPAPSPPPTHTHSHTQHQPLYTIDHFPPPSHTPRRPSFNLVNAEEKQATSTRARRSRTAGNGAATNPGLSSTSGAEIAGLHQLLDEHEVLFAAHAREVQTLRTENERLMLQVKLSHTLTGLMESMPGGFDEHGVQRPRTTEEQKEAGRPATFSSGLDPMLLSPAISGHLKKGLPGMHAQGAPTWLVQLLQAQANDPPVSTPPAHGQLQSPLSTVPRVFARGQALKYVLSTLSPSLNMRDRAVTVLFDEFVREHAWLANAFAAQTTLVTALVEHLRKRELGLDEPEERTAGVEFFRRREAEERENKRAQMQATAHANAMVMFRGAVHPLPQPQSGLIPGSAGAVPKPPSSAQSIVRPTPQVSRNMPVQVDGGGSANIGLGAEWLATSVADTGHGRVLPRPFQSQPELSTHVEALQSHIVRFVMGSGVDAPISMLRQEHAFTHDPANHSQGYSDQLGGTPVGTSAVPARSSTAPPTAATIDAEAEALRSRTGKDIFRERDGANNQVPASVRKWSTVEQLDYVTANEYSATTTSPRKQRPKKDPSVAGPVKKHERGASRQYTQTALGALSEHAAEDDEAHAFEIADPFAVRDDLRHSGSAAVDAAERARLEKIAWEEAEAARGPPLAHIHRLGLSSNTPPPSLVASATPPPHFPSLPSSAHSAHPTTPAPAHAATPAPPTSPGPAHAAGAPPPGSTFSLQSEYVPLSSLKLLYELLKYVSFKLSHTSQLKHVVHVVRRLVGADRVTLWFVDQYRKHIWSTIGTAVTNEIRVKLGVGIAGSVAASGKSVTMLNATYDQRFLKKVESGTDYITRACMAIPLKTPRHGTFAVLQIMNKTHSAGGGNSGTGYFSRADELLAHLVCQHLAQNLWGSEMLQVALREKMKTQLVFRHAEQLLSCLDVKEMLSSLVARVRMLCDADYAVLFALSPNAASEREAIATPEDAEEDDAAGARSDSRTNARRNNTRNRRPGTRGAGSNAPWSDDAPTESSAAASGAKELLSITESCTASIAIIIPQGYAADRREGFKFNAIRVPLTSGGLAVQAVQSGRVTNIFDTRLDSRFNADLDEYVSDTVGSGSGSGSAQHSTRALLVLPISGGSGNSPADGVLVLGKLVPKPFQEWEVAELDELTQVIWMGVRRYRADRIANLRMHDRLTTVNRMIATLDLEAGGTGLVMPVGAADDEAQIEQALAIGAVVVTEEATTTASFTEPGVVSLAGKMKDPVSGELLPSLAEYQRQRMLFPSAPQLGSSLADAFYKNELTRSLEHPHGTLTLTEDVEASIVAPVAVQVTDETDESEMRDPRAPALNTEAARRKHAASAKPAETLTLQREADAAHVDVEEDEDEEEQALFGSRRQRATSHATSSPAVAPAPAPIVAQPLKTLDSSKATFTAPPTSKGPLLPSPHAPRPGPTSPVLTSYKPQGGRMPLHVDLTLDPLVAFHEATVHGNHGQSDGSSSPYGAGGSSSALILPAVTVSRITLLNTTDFPQVDALKAVTYGPYAPRA